MDTQILLPLTPREEQILFLFSGVSFVVATLLIFALLIYSSYLALRTRIPGRIELFIGTLTFALFYTWTQYMGGMLEMTLGPVGVLLEISVWSISAILGSVGLIRMLKYVERHFKIS